MFLKHSLLLAETTDIFTKNDNDFIRELILYCRFRWNALNEQKTLRLFGEVGDAFGHNGCESGARNSQ